MDEDVVLARRVAIRKAIEILKDCCRDGCIVGIGTGSTVAQFIEELAKESSLNVLAKSIVFCSSIDTCLRLSRYGVVCSDIHALESVQSIDIYIDSADEVDPRCFMIKGGGGALLREKVLTEMSRIRLFVVDYRKVSQFIGTKFALPVEVIPVAYPLLKKRLESLGLPYELRMGGRKKGPVITDNGNYIVDVVTGPMKNPEEMDRIIKSVPGVAETGIFYPTHVTKILVGHPNGSLDIYEP